MEIDFEFFRQKLRQGADDYDTDRRERWTRYAHRLADLENSFPTRRPRQRPRAPLKEKLLLKLDLTRRDHLLACGELIRLGPRHWQWRIYGIGVLTEE